MTELTSSWIKSVLGPLTTLLSSKFIGSAISESSLQPPLMTKPFVEYGHVTAGQGRAGQGRGKGAAIPQISVHLNLNSYLFSKTSFPWLLLIDSLLLLILPLFCQFLKQETWVSLPFSCLTAPICIFLQLLFPKYLSHCLLLSASTSTKASPGHTLAVSQLPQWVWELDLALQGCL